MILAILSPAALMRRFPYMGQPSVPVPGLQSLVVHGNDAQRISLNVEQLLKRSQTFRGVAKGSEGLHVLSTRMGPPDTLAWYDDWSQTIYLVLPVDSEPLLEDRIPIMGHEIAHQLFRKENVQNSLLEEAFCRWLAQVISKEISDVPIDSIDIIASETISLYQGDSLNIGDLRFVTAVTSLESRGILPPGSRDTANSLLSRIEAERHQLR